MKERDSFLGVGGHGLDGDNAFDWQMVHVNTANRSHFSLFSGYTLVSVTEALYKFPIYILLVWRVYFIGCLLLGT